MNATLRLPPVAFFATPVPELTVVRRHNVLVLFRRFAESRMRAGIPPKGLEQSFAQHLQVSPSMWCQIKSSRPIGDKLARQIEGACACDGGWLDVEREADGLSAGEQRFLTQALKAWRDADAEGRRRMKAVFAEVVTSR